MKVALPVLLLATALSFGAVAQNKPAVVSTTTSTTTATPAQILDAERQRLETEAKRWSLTAKEWQRFEDIKKGPRGFWSPNLDPLTALGVEAETDAERMRFAQIQAKMEFERTERELAYQRAYSETFARLYPNVPSVQTRSLNTSGATLPIARPTEERLVLFVKPDCAPCDQQAKKLQESGKAFDIYMLGTTGNDEQLRTWARKVGIKPARVQDRSITLNHDSGTMLMSMGGQDNALPLVYRRTGGKWQRDQ